MNKVNKTYLFTIIIFTIFTLALLIVLIKNPNTVDNINVNNNKFKFQPTINKNIKDGVTIEDIVAGTGKEVTSDKDDIVIHYVGILENGTVFDSSLDRNQKLESNLQKLIKGWQIGIPGMKIGGKRKLTIPPSLGYGSTATGKIPANSTLIFEVELFDVKSENK